MERTLSTFSRYLAVWCSVVSNVANGTTRAKRILTVALPKTARRYFKSVFFALIAVACLMTGVICVSCIFSHANILRVFAQFFTEEGLATCVILVALFFWIFFEANHAFRKLDSLKRNNRFSAPLAHKN